MKDFCHSEDFEKFQNLRHSESLEKYYEPANSYFSCYSESVNADGKPIELDLSSYRLNDLSTYKRKDFTTMKKNKNVKNLFTYLPIHLFTPPKKAAFTLAEVLITLGIIGVVAAMTIPVLINKYRAKELQTRLKRADAIIQQAALRAKADGVNLDEVLEQKKYEDFETYFKNGNCELPKNDVAAGYLNYTGKAPTSNAAAQKLVHSYCLFDGMILWFGEFKIYNQGSFLAVDINGWKNKPNRYGHDVFFWYYNSETGMLLPIGTNVFTSDSSRGYNFWEECPGHGTAEQGIACTQKALTDNKYFENLLK